MAIITIDSNNKKIEKLLATQLAEKLGYKAFDREIIDICSRKYNIMPEDLLKELEEVPGLWQRLTGKQHKQLIYIKCALFDAIKEDNIIYYGYFGPLFLSGLDNVLKVFIDMPFEKRVNDLMNELNISKEKAIEKIDEFDRSKQKLVKMLYDVDWQNLSLYDISINMENISLETATEIIATAIDKGNFKTTEKSKNALKMYSAENEIKAAIAADDNLWDQDIFIKAKGNKIIVSGAIKDKKLKEDLIETVKQVKGVENVTFFVDTLDGPMEIKPFTDS